ncbi:MAG TPA: TolC family protein [Cyclobacteriaceae bacterium]|nr:TolC family protein [Cyclobacteriaceae bacterium]
MFKKTVFAFSVCLLSFAANAQTDEVTSVLLEIEQNNESLKAYTSLKESMQLELKSGNNLPDPQAGAYYLPFGNHASGDYSEFQVTQSLEFPTVYGVRNNLIEKQKLQMELEYELKRQEVLLPAKMHCIQLIHLNKRRVVEQLRVTQAKRIFDQVQELFKTEQVGILEVHKAKIAWMQEQFKVAQVDSDRKNIGLLLQNLNGGKEIVFNQTDYTEDLKLGAMDSIWQVRQSTDPEIKILTQQDEVARQQIKLSKSKSLPNLTAGFNYQGVSGSNYSGVYGGLSIPLWNNRNKVKAAEARYQYQQSHSSAQSLAAYASFQNQYNEYQILFDKFNEYESTLEGLNSDSLLLEAYELGEIGFMAYYTELQFYRQAVDTMLEMEKQLNQIKIEILKHQL